MTDSLTAPYGAWPSPISATDVAKAGLRLGYPTIVGDEVWWQETRPEENGRTAIIHRAADGMRTQVVPEPFDARTRVIEYGGRAYLPVPSRGGWGIVFANYRDQRLYLAEPKRAPRPITPEPGEPAGLRYADLVLSPDRTAVWCVQERHDTGRVSRAIVAVPLDGSAVRDPSQVRELVSGQDFFAFPRPSPDGRHLAWIAWNHPKMPWDGTVLRIATVAEDGTVGKPRTIKGGPTESVLAPWWRDERSLYVVSDWSGWWNLYQVSLYGDPPQALYPAEEEFAGPLWQLGGQPFVVLGDGRIAVLHGHGDQRLGIYDPETGEITDLDVPYTDWQLALSADGMVIVGVAAGPTTPTSVVRLDVPTGRVESLRRELEELPDAAYLPTPREVELEGQFGRTVHAFIYPPSNPEVRPPDGELPPYVVWVHGGPTSQVSGVLDLEKAYFTSRGIGVIDVNYGGSTGYGRHYRERLRKQWGIVDVEDAVAAAEALVKQGEADPDRLAIRGGSAGGWTTLAAITTSTVFKAGTSYFGVADPLKLAEETHDFESRYLDGLIGPLPGFEKTYEERAPLSRAERIACPVLLLQGLDDPIVPPSQSERFASVLERKRIPHAYLTFEGEAHGFRRAETRVACLEAELSFYGQVLGFTPRDIPKLKLSPGRKP